MREISNTAEMQSEPEQAQNETNSDKDVLDTENIENLQCKLNYVQKLLEGKEEFMKVLEDNLKSTKNELTDLTKCFSTLQMDRDAKMKEIVDLQRAIDFHTNTIDELQRERLESRHEILYHGFEEESSSSNLFSNNKLQNEIKLLKFDLDVMEGLYKNCYEEMINQETTINNLRQACLDYSAKEIDLKIDIEMLTSQLKSANNHQSPCVQSKDFENDLSEISAHLNSLKRMLLVDVTVEDNERKICYENLKVKYAKLKSDIAILKLENAKLRKKNNEKYKCRNKNKINSSYDFKAMLKDFKEFCKNLLGQEVQFINQDYSKYRQENESMKEEIVTLKAQLSQYEKNINNYNESITGLNNKMINVEESVKNFNEKNRKKTDRVSWLESQLNESTEKGVEMCKTSKDIFEYVHQLLKQVKEERRNVLEKKVMLQKVLKFLSGKEDILKYINCETLFKN